MTARLPLAVIGGGAIGLRHAQVAAASAQVDLAGVVEPFAPRRADLAALGLNAVAALEDLPAATRAAIVATPTQDHFATARECVRRGWAVLVEKPLAATLDQGRALIAAAAAAGVPLFVGHHRRHHPFCGAARDAIAGLGDPVGVQGLWSLRKPDRYFDAEWRRRPGAGPLMTNLSHEIDLLRFLLGEIVEVFAMLSSARRGLAIEDTAALSFRFASGALGAFLISDAGASPWAFEAATGENPAIAASGQDYLRILGTEAALEFPSLARWGRSVPGEIEWSRPLLRTQGAGFAAIDPLSVQIERFAGAVGRGGGDTVLCGGGDGLAALEWTLAAALSAQRQHPVRSGEVPGDFNGT